MIPSRLAALVLPIVFVVSAVSVCRADSVSYTILGPAGLADCTFSTPGSYQVFATLHLSSPARALKVSMGSPSCGGNGIIWSYPASGDPASELTLDFGGCISGSVPLFTAQFDVFGCCPALLRGPITGPQPDQESPPVLIGCDNEPRYLIPPCSASSPALLTPPNGATVTRTPFLSWDYDYGSYCQEGIGLAVFTIQYGTDPANLNQILETLDSDSPSATLPVLLPNTQYFWRIRVWDEFAIYTGTKFNFSETRSFTTNDVVATRPATWGHVKTMYRK